MDAYPHMWTDESVIFRRRQRNDRSEADIRKCFIVVFGVAALRLTSLLSYKINFLVTLLISLISLLYIHYDMRTVSLYIGT